jgi:hypothetical protein
VAIESDAYDICDASAPNVSRLQLQSAAVRLTSPTPGAG